MRQWIQDEVERVADEMPESASVTRYAQLIRRLRAEWPNAELEDVARCVAQTRMGLVVSAFVKAWSEASTLSSNAVAAQTT